MLEGYLPKSEGIQLGRQCGHTSSSWFCTSLAAVCARAEQAHRITAQDRCWRNHSQPSSTGMPRPPRPKRPQEAAAMHRLYVPSHGSLTCHAVLSWCPKAFSSCFGIQWSQKALVRVSFACDCHWAPTMSLVPGNIRAPLPRSSQISTSLDVTAFDLGPSTSYGTSEQSLRIDIRPLYIRTKGRRRARAALFSSTTAAALQNTQWQHNCFAALRSEVKKSVRQHMMGWPADVRRFLAGAFAGADRAAWLLSLYGCHTQRP